MKKKKFLPEFEDIPSPRHATRQLPAAEREDPFAEIDLGFVQEVAVAEARRCLACRRCIGCGLCLAECDRRAIVYDERPEIMTLDVGAVILAPGGSEFDARRAPGLGYTSSLDVVSSMEFERILSRSGPFGGIPMRPFDGEVPRRVAFIQCVGSRDIYADAPFCSTICCQAMLRQARELCARVHTAEVVVFHRGVRPLRREGDQSLLLLEEETRVRFIPVDSVEVHEENATGHVDVRYRNHEGEETDRFDLVVLSTGVRGPKEAAELARRSRIKVTRQGFAVRENDISLSSSRDGVFAIGSFAGPMEIGIAASEGIGGALAAAKAIGLTAAGSAAGGSVDTAEEGATTDPGDAGQGRGEGVGLLFCLQGLERYSRPEIDELVDRCQMLPGLSRVMVSPAACVRSKTAEVVWGAADDLLSRLIVVGCRPTTHHLLLSSVAGDLGIDPARLSIVPSGGQGERGLAELGDEVERAVERSAEAPRIAEHGGERIPRVLVVGGGAAGCTAALEIASFGFEVDLVENGTSLGSDLDRLQSVGWEGRDGDWVAGVAARVESESLINLHLSSRVTSCTATDTGFRSTIVDGEGSERVLEHGAAVLSGKAEECHAALYRYGEDPRVMTQVEFSRRLLETGRAFGTVLMIPSAVSGCPERPYCSSICCDVALRDALRVRALDPDGKVYILHQGLRTYGFGEERLLEAEETGVAFIRCAGTPALVDGERLTIEVRHAGTDESSRLEPDVLVIGAGITPPAENRELTAVFGLQIDDDGFLSIPNPGLWPVDPGREGLFVCGLSHEPLPLVHQIAEARAASARACRLLLTSKRA